MKHFILTIILAIACTTTTFAQDCIIPASMLRRGDYNQSYDKNNNGYRGQHDGAVTRNMVKKFYKEHGFSEEMKNTRLAICLNYISTTRTLQLRVSLYDTENNIVFYSIKLDTCYAEEDIFDLYLRMDNDLFTSKNQQFNDVLDTIHAKIIEMYESNKSPWMSTVKQHIADGYPDWAMFQLAQYPQCAPSYPQLKPFIAATYREYVRKDHNELIRQAKLAWKEQENETDARFVVSLLNREELSEGKRKQADKILKKVAETYPNIDINAKEDYTSNPELTEVAIRMAYKIALTFSEQHAPEVFNFIPEV